MQLKRRIITKPKLLYASWWRIVIPSLLTLFFIGVIVQFHLLENELYTSKISSQRIENWLQHAKNVLPRLSNGDMYSGGLPRYPRIFARDSIISALLMSDKTLLKNIVDLCVVKQGHRIDAHTAEEPGKIFHEMPPVSLNDRSTAYAASDTTALFLIAVSKLEHNAVPLKAVFEATDYLLRHVDKRGLFVEAPSFVDATSFALPVTYWKDSIVVGRKNGIPFYPVSYTLAHIQVMAALRAVKPLLNSYYSMKVQAILPRMLSALRDTLWDKERGCLIVGIDNIGALSGDSSDGLHSLYYLDQGDLSIDHLELMVKHASLLVTPVGIRTASLSDALLTDDKYHSATVWPFENAIIHAGLVKHNIGFSRDGTVDLREVCERSNIAMKASSSFPETFVDILGTPGGCHTQLWSIAAAIYFETTAAKAAKIESSKVMDINSSKVLGVSASKQYLYRYSATLQSFSCLFTDNPPMLLPFSAINDDYCDCPDGSDEPGTSACAGIAYATGKSTLFECNDNYESTVERSRHAIDNSFVHDGICDCFCGQDEPEHAPCRISLTRNVCRT